MRRFRHHRMGDACAAALFAGALVLWPALAAAEQSAQAPSAAASGFLAWLANPNVAYVLFVVGLMGLVGELVTPGATLPGVAGTVCLVLALVGLRHMPTNWGGALLIVIAIVAFVLDLHVPGHWLSAGGAGVFLLGSVLLFTPFWVPEPADAHAARLSPWLIVGATIGVGGLFAYGTAVGLRAQGLPLAMGRETLIGKVGTVRRTLDPTGIVHVDGEEWSARSAGGETIAAGAEVQVVAAEGLVLKVVAVVAGSATRATVAAEQVATRPAQPDAAQDAPAADSQGN